MAHVLGIGNATIDLVHSLAAYPAENDEVRCDARSMRRGGNAANSLVVLAQSGHDCDWAGVLAGDADGRFVRDDLAAAGVGTMYCRIEPGGSMPVSMVMLSAATGSRTIVHYRDLPEFGAADFAAIPLQDFDWLHFEGRSPAALHIMLERVRAQCPAMPVSLEVEKPRDGIEALFDLVDVLLFSAAYARHYGHEDPSALLRSVANRRPGADLFCAAGAAGAVGMDRAGFEYRQPALVTGPVVDTLGAGDVFNAGVINGCLLGHDMAGILRGACELAGRKCRQTGFTGLGYGGSSL
jgi:ketohexokinase